jgi:hypothetical protein
MNTFSQKYWKYALFAFIGAGLGFAYWRFIGCTSGSCPLTSNWQSTTLFGGLIGVFAVPGKSKVKEETAKTDDNSNTDNNSNSK